MSQEENTKHEYESSGGGILSAAGRKNESERRSDHVRLVVGNGIRSSSLFRGGRDSAPRLAAPSGCFAGGYATTSDFVSKQSERKNQNESN